MNPCCGDSDTTGRTFGCLAASTAEQPSAAALVVVLAAALYLCHEWRRRRTTGRSPESGTKGENEGAGDSTQTNETRPAMTLI